MTNKNGSTYLSKPRVMTNSNTEKKRQRIADNNTLIVQIHPRSIFLSLPTAFAFVFDVLIGQIIHHPHFLVYSLIYCQAGGMGR